MENDLMTIDLEKVRQAFGAGRLNKCIERYFNGHYEPVVKRQEIVSKFVAINFTSRVGSTYFSELLDNNTELKNIGETLNDRRFAKIQKRLQTTDTYEVVHEIIKSNAHQGVFGYKGGALTLLLLILTGILESHKDKTKFILLKRNDVLNQALSIFKAKFSNVWHIVDTKKDVETRKTQNKIENPHEIFDYDRILNQIMTIVRVNSSIQSFYTRSGFAFLTIAYEDLTREPTEVITNVLNYCECRVPANFDLRSSFSITRDQTNAIWRELFLERYSKDKEGREWFAKNSVKLTADTEY
jgi:LPS sulfotransferase NodH